MSRIEIPLNVFVKLKNEYDRNEKNYFKIKRAQLPSDLREMSDFYDLLKKIPAEHKEGLRRNLTQFSRIIYMFPYVKHSEKAKRLGESLSHKITEFRMKQFMKTQGEQEIRVLRNLCRISESPYVNTEKVGRMLFYWNDNQKRRIVEDYYMSFV